MVTIKATETNSGLVDYQSFNLLVKCVQSITPVSLLSDIVYYITDPAETRTHAYSLLPVDCPNELTYQVTLANGDPLPASITHSSPTISVFSSIYAAASSYVVKVVATDPKTGVTNSDTTFAVAIKCTKKVDLVSGLIIDFSYQIVLATPFELTVSLPVYDTNPAACPKQPFSYQMLYLDAATFPSFITETPTTDVRVMTQNVSYVGLHNFKLKVTEPLTGLFNDQDIFVCTIVAPYYATALNFVT